MPAVRVSPRIAPGAVFRVPAKATLLDHTSILKTFENRWKVPALRARDSTASDINAVLTLSAARTDDPLQGVVVPVTAAQAPGADQPSHLQKVHAALVAKLPVPDRHGGTHPTMPPLGTGDDYTAYIHARTNAWKASRGGKTCCANRDEPVSVRTELCSPRT